MIAWPPRLPVFLPPTLFVYLPLSLPVWLVGLRFGVGLVAAPYLRLLEVLLGLAEGRALGLTVT